jgi:signal transduction histidine kinase
LTNTSGNSAVQSAPDTLPNRRDPADVPEANILARLSHEMRTPLSAIVGYAQLLQCGTPLPSESQQRSIALILNAGWHLEKLLHLASELGTLQSGSLALSLSPVPLASVMRDCEAFIESRAQLRGVSVRFPALEPSCVVFGDAVRLGQILSHLLSAAIDYSDVGGSVVLECETSSTEWIHFHVHEGATATCAEPPPDGHLTAVGRHAPDSAAMESAGLDVLVAKHLVELMRGRLCASSMVGAGRLFSFELRRVPVPVATALTSIQSPVDAPSAAGTCDLHSTQHTPECPPTNVA